MYAKQKAASNALHEAASQICRQIVNLKARKNVESQSNKHETVFAEYQTGL